MRLGFYMHENQHTHFRKTANFRSRFLVRFLESPQKCTASCGLYYTTGELRIACEVRMWFDDKRTVDCSGSIIIERCVEVRMGNGLFCKSNTPCDIVANTEYSPYGRVFILLWISYMNPLNIKLLQDYVL